MSNLAISLFCPPDGSLRPGWRFALCVACFLFAEYACAYIALALVRQGQEVYFFEAVYRPLLLVVFLVGFGLILRVTEKAKQKPIAAQGLDLSAPWPRQLIWGTLLGFVIVSISVATVAFFGSYSLHFASVDIAKIIFVLWILITSAAAEEVAFRGYPFQMLVRATGKWSAVLLMSALFGAIHWSNPDASAWSTLNTALVGVLLALAYLRTNTLWLPIGVHFGWNMSLGLLYGLPVSGVTIFSVLTKGTAAGSRWLTGGDYGVEASFAGAVVICLGIVLLMLGTSERRSHKWLYATGAARIESIDSKN